MVLGHIIGAGMILPAIAYHIYDTPKRRFKRILKASFHTHKKEGIEILELKQTEYGYHAIILLPSGITVEEFEKYLPALEQDSYAKIRFRHIWGRKCSLDFGRIPLSNHVSYEQAPKNGLPIPLATPFGWRYLDIQDGSSCHIVGGGATRMGKTCLQLLIATHLYTQSEGNIRMIISSAKDADYWMFRKCRNVSLVTPSETLSELQWVIDEYLERKRIITELGNVNDAVTLAKEYPSKAFSPIVVIVDEVAVFSDDDAVQEALTEIAERAGYVDIHLIVFSQRPDAKDVLKPRIKTNMLVKIALTTANVADSKIILGIEGAEKLGGIKGRAIMIDGLPDLIQIPYISNEYAEELLKPYWRDIDEQGQIDSEVTPSLPSFIQGSVRGDDMSRSSEAICYSEQGDEKAESGWFMLADPTTEG